MTKQQKAIYEFQDVLGELRDEIEITDDLKNACKLAIKALEQEPFINKPCVAHKVCHEDKVKVLEEIRAEIIAKDKNVKAIRSDGCCFFTADEILNILNKYKAESAVLN
jgi:hypothetical protein